MLKTQQEILQQGYQVLVESLGVADALRFIQYFSPGQGDYTRSRSEKLDSVTLESILTTMRTLPADDSTQYNEIIE